MNQNLRKLSDADFAAIVQIDRGVLPAILAGLTALDLENQDTELARQFDFIVKEIARLQPNINRVQLLLDRALVEDGRVKSRKA